MYADIVNGKFYALTGCDVETDIFRFTLNGVNYEATGDTNDDYRSYLEDLRVTGNAVLNTFPGQAVCAVERADNAYTALELINPNTGAVVVRAGTDVSDDYYPMFVAYFDPQALDANQGV